LQIKIDKFFTETDKTIGQTKIALGNSKKLLQSEINKLSNNKDWKKIRLGDFFDLYQPKTILKSDTFKRFL